MSDDPNTTHKPSAPKDQRSLSEKTRITLPAAAMVAVVGGIVSGTLGFAAIARKLDDAVTRTAEARVELRRIDDRVRTLEKLSVDVAVIRRDVEWVRRAQEKAVAGATRRQEED